MKDKNKYWIIHGGSDSYFSAKNAKDALSVVTEFNKISIEYGMPPTSKVEVVSSGDAKKHRVGLEERIKMGDEEYFQP